MLIERTVDEQGNVLREETIREQSPLMTVREAAEFLRVTNHTVYEYLRDGRLRRYRVGGYKNTRLKRAEVEALVTPAE